MSEPICARAAALEQAIWEGTIKQEQETELKAHAKECAECASILSGIDWAKYGVGALKNEEIPVPSVDAAWNKVESRLADRRSAWYHRTGWMAIAATVVVAVGVSYIALGGPTKKMFAAAVGTETMGQNQAALRGGIYDEAPRLAQLSEANALAGSTPLEAEGVGFAQYKVEGGAGDVAYAPRRPASPAAIDYGERLQGQNLRPGGTPGIFHPTTHVERAASITMGVENAREAFRTLSGIIATGGGQIVTSRVSQRTGSSGAEASLTVRIPVAQFDGFVREVHDLGLVLAEDIQGVDRTSEYTDIQGRLDDKDSMIVALRAKLTQTGISRDEVRRIELELARLRNERDRIESARRGLADKTDFATLELALREEKAAPGAVMIQFESFLDSFGDSLGIALKLFNGGLSVMVIGLGACLPWFLLAAVIRYFLRRRAMAW